MNSVAPPDRVRHLNTRVQPAGGRQNHGCTINVPVVILAFTGALHGIANILERTLEERKSIGKFTNGEAQRAK